MNGKAWRRVPVVQTEVRFRSGDAVLAGTLMVPPGAGRHAAVAWVTGSGETTRAYLPDLEALLLRHGVAVLAYDKRGIGESTGFYPGESPTAETIDVLARDAAAAARFLARQPGVDLRRVGLAGHSQAGWIMPLAAVREPAIRFLVSFSGPAVTADENDLFQTLAGEGEHPASLSDAEIDARVREAGRSGVDPVPWLRKLRIPSLWVYGGRDLIVPPRLSVERLSAIPGRRSRSPSSGMRTTRSWRRAPASRPRCCAPTRSPPGSSRASARGSTCTACPAAEAGPRAAGAA